MDKKQYLIKILEQLESVWDLARGLKILVIEGHLEEKTLNVVINAVKGAVHTVNSDLGREKIQKSLSALEKLRNMEAESRMNDEKDLAELERMLENI